jgi:lipopolysaccharide/colanic/teichoic acid biosynthesis glycosyltransferase
MGSSQASVITAQHPTGRKSIVVNSQILAQIDRVTADLDREHPQHVLAYLVTRVTEITVGAGALVFTSPIMLLIAIMIRRDSPGPILFRQTRVTKGGKLFTFYKFRTLYADARERWPEMYSYEFTREDIEKYHVKRETDPRVTNVGRWLRKTTLDELPNFWNLVRGDVALVGPRPEIPEMFPYYNGDQLLKFAVRPGITGLAQTNGRGNLSFLATSDWDVQYVRTRSTWLDIKILLRTLWLLRGDGAF